MCFFKQNKKEIKIKYVIKRDNTEQDFNLEKIKSAVYKAFCSCNREQKDFVSFIDILTNKVLPSINTNKIHIEQIQNIIEDSLMTEGYHDVAKSFIIYREKHKISRQEKQKLITKIAEKLEGADVRNQNANVDERSFGGRLGEATRVVTKDYALKYCMSEMSRNNHLNNEIYIHDLDSYAVGMHNCLSIPFDELLANGFKTRQTDVRPAGSVNTAFQLVAVIFQIQSLQQFGGVSATHLDWTMVPYVRKSFRKHYIDGVKYIENKQLKRIAQDVPIDDRKVYKSDKAYNYALDMTTKEIHQAVEGMYHNLNTLQSRSGNQLK